MRRTAIRLTVTAGIALALPLGAATAATAAAACPSESAHQQAGLSGSDDSGNGIDRSLVAIGGAVLGSTAGAGALVGLRRTVRERPAS